MLVVVGVKLSWNVADSAVKGGWGAEAVEDTSEEGKICELRRRFLVKLCKP